MELRNIARNRISAREFSREEIDLGDLLYALDVARHAPSGANQQPWRFIIVTDPKTKKRIRERCEEAERRFHKNPPQSIRRFLLEKGITWRKPFLTDAYALILVFGRKTAPYWIQSVWLSIGYLILALEEVGLASLTYTPSDTSWVHEELGVPEEYVLQAIIPVGKAKHAASVKERIPLLDLIFCGRWGSPCVGLGLEDSRSE